MSGYQKYFSPAGFPPPTQRQQRKVASGGARKSKRNKKEVALDTAIGLGLAGAGIYAAKKYKPIERIRAIFNPRLKAKREIFRMAPPQFYRALQRFGAGKNTAGADYQLLQKYAPRFFNRSYKFASNRYSPKHTEDMMNLYRMVFEHNAGAISQINTPYKAISPRLQNTHVTRAQKAYSSALKTLRNAEINKAEDVLINTGKAPGAVRQFFTPEEVRDVITAMVSRSGTFKKGTGLPQKFRVKAGNQYYRLNAEDVYEFLASSGTFNSPRSSVIKKGLQINSSNMDEWTGIIRTLQKEPVRFWRENKWVTSSTHKHMITPQEGFDRLNSRISTFKKGTKAPLYERLPKFMKPNIASSVGGAAVGGVAATVNNKLDQDDLEKRRISNKKIQ